MSITVHEHVSILKKKMNEIIHQNLYRKRYNNDNVWFQKWNRAIKTLRKNVRFIFFPKCVSQFRKKMETNSSFKICILHMRYIQLISVMWRFSRAFLITTSKVSQPEEGEILKKRRMFYFSIGDKARLIQASNREQKVISSRGFQISRRRVQEHLNNFISL